MIRGRALANKFGSVLLSIVVAACGGSAPAGGVPRDASSTVDDAGPEAAGAVSEGGSAMDDAGPETGGAVSEGGSAMNDDGSEAEGASSCSMYCAAVMSACTGANAQYIDTASCMNACQRLPSGDGGYAPGSTIACRFAQASLAAAAPNPHCWNAGPFGYGECGDTCEAFCDIVAGIQPQQMPSNGLCALAGGFDAAPPPFSSPADCILRCASFPRVDTPTTITQPPGQVGLDGGYSANGPATGDTLDCREYYLAKALQGEATRQLHCVDVGPQSATCR